MSRSEGELTDLLTEVMERREELSALDELLKSSEQEVASTRRWQKWALFDEFYRALFLLTLIAGLAFLLVRFSDDLAPFIEVVVIVLLALAAGLAVYRLSEVFADLVLTIFPSKRSYPDVGGADLKESISEARALEQRLRSEIAYLKELRSRE